LRGIDYILLFPALLAGASISLLLIVSLARKRPKGAADTLALAALASLGLWQIAGVFSLRYESTAADLAARTGLALAPSFVFHLGLIWGGVSRWLAAPAYLAAPAAWWSLGGPGSGFYPAWLCASLAVTAALLFRGAGRRREIHERRFPRALALALLSIPVAGALTAQSLAAVAAAAVAPPAVLAYFVYRYNVLGLVISRRLVFAVRLSLLYAAYVALVITVVNNLPWDYQILKELNKDIVLILAAGLIWLPLYGWITRFLSKRAQVYSDFSKRLIQEAARILDLKQRLRFLAEELAGTFHLRRVLLVIPEDPAVRGEFGIAGQTASAEAVREVAALARSGRGEMIQRERTSDPLLKHLLVTLGFNYLFPLWYEDDLTGLLFLDTSPRLFVEEDEPILAGLGGLISHSIAACRAVEGRISLERTLTQQEHLASLGKVAATIAHEIKNPLSSIKTLAQLMREDEEIGARYGRDLNYMIGETDRLNRSLQQLLSFSRPLPERQEQLDLTDLLETMGHFLARECAGNRITILANIAPQMKLRRASAEAIKQIVLNLVLNAAQACEPGGTVWLDAARTGRQIHITVTDCGPGIPEEMHERVFEPFFTTKQKGTGLGLAIVRKNVRQMEGEIRLESPIKEGRGTRVSVTLPEA
jgi:signal transduction histidine kinase